MSKAAPLELADRVEKAGEGHCYLDAEIEAALKLYPKSYPWIASFTDCRAIQGRVQVFNDMGESSANWAPPSYTSSFDAAMTLLGNSPIEDMSWWPSVPNGYESEQCCRVTIRDLDAGGFAGRQQFKARAATPALALTAACLRARANQEPSDAR